ncbi:MAG: response regulator [Polyangiales bacterium]
MSTILLVEDDEDIREVIAEILRDAGYAVIEAENGQLALEALDNLREPPCLVLLDLMMPVMSGAELLRVLDETHRLASLPVIVVSAGGDPASVAAATKFIRKPPSVGLLLQLVREFCGEGAD